MPFVLSLLAAAYAGAAISQLGQGATERALLCVGFTFAFIVLAQAFVILKLQDRLASKQRGVTVAIGGLADDAPRTRQLRSQQLTQPFRKRDPK